MPHEDRSMKQNRTTKNRPSYNILSRTNRQIHWTTTKLKEHLKSIRKNTFKLVLGLLDICMEKEKWDQTLHHTSGQIPNGSEVFRKKEG